ncbi:MAG: hypothetical protein U0174_02795 [Polyangiaceae bacterium]
MSIFARYAALSTFAVLALSFTQGGCAVATEEEGDTDESAITKGLTEGKYRSDVSASARLRPGYLYRIEISKRSYSNQYATVYLVSAECGKQRADKTCDRNFIESNPKSLDKHWNNIKVQTSKKTFSFDYEKPSPDGFETQTLTWSYKSAPRGGLTLTPKGSSTSFTMSKAPALPKIAESVKKNFETWMEEIQGDTSEIDSGTPVDLDALPLEAKRIAYYFDQEYSGDYSQTATKINVKGTSYYALSQGTDGGGYYYFFTMAGAYVASYGGSESGEWDFDWNE